MLSRAAHPRALPASGRPRLFRDAAREAALERDARAPERIRTAPHRLVRPAARVKLARLRLDAALAFDPQLRRRRRARRRVRARASPCSPAKPAPASRSCSTRSACCSATASSCGSCAPGAERAELAAEFDVADAPAVARVARRAGARRRRRRSAAAPRARRAGHEPRVDQRPARHARAAEGAGRDAGRPSTASTRTSRSRSRRRSAASSTRSAASRRWRAKSRERWRAWRAAVERRDAAAHAARGHRRRARIPRRAPARTRGARRHAKPNGRELSAAQSRLANAADLIAAATQGGEALSEGDDALAVRLAQLDAAAARRRGARSGAGGRRRAARARGRSSSTRRRARCATTSAASTSIPTELERVEERLVGDPRHGAQASRAARSAARAARRNRGAPGGARRIRRRRGAGRARGARRSSSTATPREQLSKKRRFARQRTRASRHRGDAGAARWPAAGSRSRSSRWPRPQATGSSSVEFRVASHPKQPLGPLARVASGGELSRIALAIQVVASEVGQVPTLVFDEVDSGIGGAVAATVGAPAAGARRAAAGAVRDAPAAGGGVRRRAFPREQDGQRRQA